MIEDGDRGELASAFVPFAPRVVTRRPPFAGHALVTERADDEGPSDDDTTPSPEPGADVMEAVEEAPPVDPIDEIDDSRHLALVREQAIGIAGKACARALHAAIARNPLFIARFVEDAIAAAGPSPTRVRLSPADAQACGAFVDAEVVADRLVARGEVVVDTADGSVRATIEKRCAILVRAAAQS